MATKRFATVLAAASVVTLASLLIPSTGLGTGEIQAGTISHTRDSDFDCLPDVLEQVLMSNPARTDSDGDRVEDLDEFLAGSHLWLSSSKGSVAQGMCLAVTTELLTMGVLTERVFWAHLGFKVASGRLTDLQGVNYYGHINGTTLSLNNYMQDPRNSLTVRTDNTGAIKGVLSIRISLGVSVRPTELTQPFQFCGGGLIAKKPYISANFMFPTGGTYLSLLPFMPGGIMAFLPMNPNAPQLQFWESSCEVCVVNKTVAGVIPGHVIYEITSAKCAKVSLPKSCKPGCETMTGSIIVGLDGWSLTGL